MRKKQHEPEPDTKHKKSYTCKICCKSGFSSTYKLNAHLFLHKAVGARHQCSYCDKEFYRADEYSRHIARHEKKQKHFFCDHCDRSFVDKRNLILHLHIHDDLPRLTEYRFKCTACNANYCERRLLKHHIGKEHLNLISVEPTHITKDLNETWIEEVRDTKNCVQITKITPNMLTIKRCKIKQEIKNNNIDKKPLPIIPFMCTRVNNYSKAICDYCNKEMLKKSVISHIRERHLKLRRFHCEFCNRTFMRHYQLCDHVCGKVRQKSRRGEKKK